MVVVDIKNLIQQSYLVFCDQNLTVVCRRCCHRCFYRQKRFLLIFFFRFGDPISTKIGTMHPLDKGILIYYNEGQHTFNKENNY